VIFMVLILSWKYDLVNHLKERNIAFLPSLDGVPVFPA